MRTTAQILKKFETSRLTRRQLEIWREEGLISPTEFGNKYGPGYYYSAAETEKIQQIILFKTLGFNLKKIKSLLEASPEERRTAIKSNLAELERQQKELEELLSYAKLISLYGSGFAGVLQSVYDLHGLETYLSESDELGKKIPVVEIYAEEDGIVYDEDDLVRSICFLFEEAKAFLPGEEKKEETVKNFLQKGYRFLENYSEDPKSSAVMESAADLYAYCKEHFPSLRLQSVSMLADIFLDGDGEFAERVQKVFSEETALTIGEALRYLSRFAGRERRRERKRAANAKNRNEAQQEQ